MIFDTLIKECSKTIVGNEFNLKLSLAAIISQGSILIEDYPGSGKTNFAKTLTLSLGLDFKRIQFTSDLLPSDILGYNFLSKDNLVFQKGPIFTNIVLADELNRGSSKSQSAFLEAMEEKNVSIDGVTYNLPYPFFVIATQNPMDSSGTSLLPDSQLDRFMISFSLSNLSNNQLVEVIKNNIDYKLINNSKINWEEIFTSRNKVKINDDVFNYILEIFNLAKNIDYLFISPRCLKQISDLSKSWALINEKDYVSHQDVKDILPSVLRHRISSIKSNEDKLSLINNDILDKIEINY